MGTYSITIDGQGEFEITAPDGVTQEQLRDAAFSQISSELSDIDLSVARSKDNPFGQYLRSRALETTKTEDGTPETALQRQERLYGKLGPGQDVGIVEGVTRGAGSGLTFGAMNDIVAAGAAGLNKLRGDERPYNDIRQIYRIGQDEKKAQFQKEHPVLAIGSEVVGAVPTAIATGGQSVPAGIGRMMLQGGKQAAVQGGIYGFNTGRGGLGGRLQSAAKTGAISAPMGVAAPIAGRGLSRLAQTAPVQAAGRFVGDVAEAGVGAMRGRGNFGNIYNALRATGGPTRAAARQAGIPEKAYPMFARNLAADDLTGNAHGNIARGGRVAHAGTNAKTMLDDAVATGGPEARAMALTGVGDDVAAASQRTSAVLDDTLGSPIGVKTVETAIRRGTATSRGQAYQAAYDTPINYADDVGREIEGLVRNNVPHAAIEKANAMIRATPDSRAPQIMATVADDGTATFQQMPNMEQLDFITRALRDVADEASGKGKLGGTTDTGRIYANLARSIRDRMRQAVPAYGEALDTAADAITQREALLVGEKVLRPSYTRAELADDLSGLTGAAQRRMVAQGLRDQIDELMANVKRTMGQDDAEAREAWKALQFLSSRANKQKTAMVIGDEKADALFRVLDRQTAAFEAQAAVAKGSQTATRLATQEARKNVTSGGVVENLRRGELAGAAREAIASVGGRSKDDILRIDEETSAAMVRALMSSGPNGQRILRQAIDSTNRRLPGDQTTREVMNRVLRGLAGTAAGTGTTKPVEKQVFE